MQATFALPGSAFHPEDRPRAGHQRTRPLTQREDLTPIDLTLMVRERPGATTVQQSLALVAGAPLGWRRFNRVALAARHEFLQADRDHIVSWARSNGLRVLAEDPATRRITVRGSAARAAQLFGVRLERFRLRHANGTTVEYRGHLGPVRIPADIAPLITGVFGLDDRPVASPTLHSLDEARPGIVSYDPPEIARVYRYPRLPNDGAGMHIVAGMIELGGTTHDSDVTASFCRMGMRPPEILHVRVDGAVPVSDPEGADVEIALDYQVIGAMVQAMAPKAALTIVSYDAPNTERGFIDAAAAAATDRVHAPGAVSISWGSTEDNWSRLAAQALDATFAMGSLRGVTYSAAAGDAGSTDGIHDGRQHPGFPASSPHVWACGGTTLLATRDGILSESVWNELRHGQGAAGSGVSTLFAPPSYQSVVGISPRSADDGRPGRGLPDASGVADPVTGWNVLALGRLRTTGGTSAVAPMYTALWSLVNALSGRRIGLPHPLLYRARQHPFNDVTRGDSGGPYRAGTGWDPASGWGTPNGRAVARALGVAQVAIRRRGPAARVGERSLDGV